MSPLTLSTPVIVLIVSVHPEINFLFGVNSVALLCSQ